MAVIPAFTLFLLLAVFFLSSFQTIQKTQAEEQEQAQKATSECDPDGLTECIAPFTTLDSPLVRSMMALLPDIVTGKGIPEKQSIEICKQIQTVAKCLGKELNACVATKELETLFNAPARLMEMCDSSDFYSSFQLFSTCNEAATGPVLSACYHKSMLALYELQAAFESRLANQKGGLDMEKLYSLLCCPMKGMLDCYLAEYQRKCSRPAVNLVQKIHKTILEALICSPSMLNGCSEDGGLADWAEEDYDDEEEQRNSRWSEL